MRLLSPLALAASFAVSLLAAETAKQYSHSVKLTYELVGSSSKPQSLAEISYDPKTLKTVLSSWTPPSTDHLKSSSIEAQSKELVRISTPSGSATVTTLASFDPALSQYIDLWLSVSPDAEIFSASITSISPPPLSEEEQRQKRKEERARAKGKPVPSAKPSPKSKPKKKDGKTVVTEEQPSGPIVKVNIHKATPGVSPKLLTRPKPQVDAEGREIVQEVAQEKTLFQKYWWVGLVIMFLLIGQGNDGDKK